MTAEHIMILGLLFLLAALCVLEDMGARAYSAKIKATLQRAEDAEAQSERAERALQQARLEIASLCNQLERAREELTR